MFSCCVQPKVIVDRWYQGIESRICLPGLSSYKYINPSVRPYYHCGDTWKSIDFKSRRRFYTLPFTYIITQVVEEVVQSLGSIICIVPGKNHNNSVERNLATRVISRMLQKKNRTVIMLFFPGEAKLHTLRNCDIDPKLLVPISRLRCDDSSGQNNRK